MFQMIKKQWKVILALSLLCVLLCGCEMPTFRAPENNSSVDEPTKVVENLPTFTPTPSVILKPVLPEVDGEATGIHPQLSGQKEPIWDSSEAIAITKKLKDKGNTTAEFRVLWSAERLFVQVHVKDITPDNDSEDVDKEDCVWFFLNEGGNLPDLYSVGDCFFIVNRKGEISSGVGAKVSDILCSTYEDGENGYYVEVGIPFLSITAETEKTIGFDVRVNDSKDKKLQTSLQWADGSGYTQYNLHGVGLLTLQ